MYLELVKSFRSRMWVSMSPCLNLCRPIIHVFHDESTLYANSDQSFHWTDGSRQALKQKLLGNDGFQFYRGSQWIPTASR